MLPEASRERAGAGAPAHRRVRRRLAHARVVGEAEVVARAQQQHGLAVEHHARPLGAAHHAHAAIEAEPLELVQSVLQIQHVAPSCGSRLARTYMAAPDGTMAACATTAGTARSPIRGTARRGSRSAPRHRGAARPARLASSPTSTGTASATPPATPIGLLDALYFGAVSVTSTGYGDITPVTDGARLVNMLLVMPAGVLFLVILVSTTLEVLAERTRTHYREKLWRKTLRDHIIVCGYGVKGQAAIDTLLATDRKPSDIVVIDARPDVVDEATRRGFAGIVADASTQAALEAAGIRDAAAVVVAPDRDDTRRPHHAHRARAQPARADRRLRPPGGERAPARAGRRGLRRRLVRRRGPAARPRRAQPARRAGAGGPALASARGLDIIERAVGAGEVGQPLAERTPRRR